MASFQGRDPPRDFFSQSVEHGYTSNTIGGLDYTKLNVRYLEAATQQVINLGTVAQGRSRRKVAHEGSGEKRKLAAHLNVQRADSKCDPFCYLLIEESQGRQYLE
ncbi:hypothetical protein KBY28_20945 [Ruegeria pomeroyi]|nr:hypothetical protein [Ruegeria pomeroyi]